MAYEGVAHGEECGLTLKEMIRRPFSNGFLCCGIPSFSTTFTTPEVGGGGRNEDVRKCEGERRGEKV